jgi:hypothetical protein
MKIAMCGCMMQEAHVVEKIRKSYRFVDIVFGTHNIFKLAELLFEDIIKGKMVVDVWDGTTQIVEDLPSESDVLQLGFTLNYIQADSDVTIVKDRAFINADCLKVVTIHDNVTWIEYSAFDDCDELTNVSIGSGILKIFDRAFYSCDKLGLVYCKAVNPPISGYRMFHNNASGRKIYVPSASVDAYKSNSYWRDYSGTIYGYDF